MNVADLSLIYHIVQHINTAATQTPPSMILPPPCLTTDGWNLTFSNTNIFLHLLLSFKTLKDIKDYSVLKYKFRNLYTINQNKGISNVKKM